MTKTTPFIVLSMGLVSCLPSIAQTEANPAAPSNQVAKQPANPDQQAHHLSRKLGLSPDQEAQLKPILESRQQQVEAVRDDNKLAARDKGAKVHAIRQDTEAKLRAVLTDDQKQKYDSLKQEMQQRRYQQ